MTEFTVAPSALAYLYADMLQDMCGPSAVMTLSEKLPCREVQVKKKDMATLILYTAFAYWVRAGCLRLGIETKGLLIKSKYVTVSRTPTPATRSDGLEAQLLTYLTGRAKDDSTAGIVARWLRKDSIDPWGAVIHEVQRYLASQGYFVESERKGLGKLLGKELQPQCDKIASLQGQVNPVRDLLSALRTAQPDVSTQLWKDIGSGITGRQETPDSDLS